MVPFFVSRCAQFPLVLVAALVVAMTTPACSRSDAAVQAELQKQLTEDPVTREAHLAATVTGGVAHLSGETQTLAQQKRALEIAKAVKGIKTIDSSMRRTDAALTQAIKDAIASDPAVADVPLTIEVQQGQVHLISDQTNADQRTKLVSLARGVEGVTGVEDLMK